MYWLLIQWHEHEEDDREGTEKTKEKKKLKEGKAESLLFQSAKGRLLL